jgi:hypothetical protein
VCAVVFPSKFAENIGKLDALSEYRSNRKMEFNTQEEKEKFK